MFTNPPKTVSLSLDVDLNIFEAIEKLKKEKNIILLAHYYQDADIQDIADYLGDSLGLAQQAAATDADIIVFAGVHFMAETAKILNPTKKVLIPDFKAGCSLADSIMPEDLLLYKAKYPNHLVISYINCSATIKALSDIICTSSNAEKIIQSLPKEQPILFTPDKNLGAYLNKKTGRNMLLWNGACMVHELFSLEKIVRLKIKYPEALFIAHPECEEALLNYADFIGSTTALLDFTKKSAAQTFIVATESGILHKMKSYNPTKEFIPAPPNNACACNDCSYMKLNTIEKLYLCMRDETPEIVMDEQLRQAALKPLERMLKISSQ